MRIITYLFVLFLSINISAQDFGRDNHTLSKYIQRMYANNDLNAVKIIKSDNGIDYLVSIIIFNNDSSISDITRGKLAFTKAKSQISQYLNGTKISNDIIIESMNVKSTNINNQTAVSSTEIYKESSTGFIDRLQFLTKFNTKADDKIVYVFYKELL